MIRQTLATLLAVALSGFCLAADDEKPDVDDPPPVLKKKKPKVEDPPDKDKKPEPKKLDPKDPDPKDEPKDPELDPKAVLERINKNIRESEERLRTRDTSDGTRQVQKDIVKDLESLIDRTKQQQDEPPPSGAGGNPKDPKEPRTGKGRPRSRPDKRPGTGDPKDDPMTGKNGNNGGAGSESNGPTSKQADLFKDIWGHLPEQMRMEMDAYSRERYMAKYSDLLKQYYSRLAEKGRRTENDR